MRSRTGCLTCRHRKLKCDEQKPVCGQCQKASRDCQPSSGIVFRNQQNPSMNRLNQGAVSDDSLKGFYAYKNTFDEDSVWLDIPKHVTFINTTNPYADPVTPELDRRLSTPARLASIPRQDGDWDTDNQFSGVVGTVGLTHGLEALSAAASATSYPYLLPEANMAREATPFNVREVQGSRLTTAGGNISSPFAASPPVSMTSSNNNLNFILNPASTMTPPIDPNLESPSRSRARPFSNVSPSPRHGFPETRPDAHIETQHEVAFLLRHFSEGPGQWMDLFDFGSYFQFYVPVKAISNPLLKYAACAYAAKQLGRVNGSKAVVGGVSSNQASMEVWPDAEKVDWAWYGAKYYDKAISLLMETLQQDRNDGPLTSPPLVTCNAQSQSHLEGGGVDRAEQRRSPDVRSFAKANSDELLAATSILSVYEFLDGSIAAWSRHLSGTKSLLDIPQVGMMPLETALIDGSFHSQRREKPSKARKAIFWVFARQDFSAAFINECQTRIDTENTQLWRDAGLHLDEKGLIIPSNTTESGYPEGDDAMKEDMISNGLVFLMSKLVNYIAAGESLFPRPAGHRSEEDQVDEPMEIGISQKTLLERWCEMQNEIDVWYNGLPVTFKPCARVKPPPSALHLKREVLDTGFCEVWYAMPMCASTMQNFHMARILLLINKPHETTARRSTVANRLKSYRSIEAEIRYHSHEICGISLSRLDASTRLNSLQPLFVAGQCLTEPSARRLILGLLRSIESDLGWATEYRVQQLLKEWGWDEDHGLDES